MATTTIRKVGVCLCRHGAEDHAEGACSSCNCKRFWARPCKCGHRPEEHSGSCQECSCQHYQIDKSPEWLLRMRVRAGQWRTALKAHDRGFMSPQMELSTRVYSFLLSKATGREKRRIAIKGYKENKPVPVQPADILKALNAGEVVARLELPHITRALRQLEAWGLIRVAGMPVRGHRIIGCYSRPRPVRKPASSEDRNVTKSDNISDDNSPVINDLIISARKTLVKRVSEALRKELEAIERNGNVTKSDNKLLAQEIVDKALNVIRNEYISRLEVIRGGNLSVALYKEEEVIERSNRRRRQTPAEPPPPDPAPEPSTTTTNDLVAETLNSYVTTDLQAIALLKERVAAVAPDATEAEIVHAIHQKGKLSLKKDNPTGFLLTAVPNLFRGAAPWRTELRAARQRAEEWEATQRAESLEMARQAIQDPATDSRELEIWLTAYPELRCEVPGQPEQGKKEPCDA